MKTALVIAALVLSSASGFAADGTPSGGSQVNTGSSSNTDKGTAPTTFGTDNKNLPQAEKPKAGAPAGGSANDKPAK